MAISSVTPAELHARMAAGGPIDLIDVRSALEWNGGHVVGARHVPLGSLDPAAVMAARLGKAEDPIYVICASGGRSAAACDAFHRAGFTQAVNVAGGTSAWAGAGLPIERNVQAVGLGLVKQVGILALVAGVVLFLMPCSPMSVWGAAYCPTPAAAPSAPVGAVDFASAVVGASATTPVLVDFHATWCPPCTRLSPEIEALAAERGDRLRVVKIDVDQEPRLAQEHRVSSIPDIRLFIAGKEAGRFAGYKSKADIGAWIDAAVQR